MTDETTLLPCPFCGSKAEVETHDPENEGVWCHYVIHCPECDGKYHDPDGHGIDISFCGNDLHILTEAWNRRYTEDDLK